MSTQTWDEASTTGGPTWASTGLATLIYTLSWMPI
jgi:hypothetical protein